MAKVASHDAARLRITLLDLDPAHWREVEVPLSMTFKGLHDTIQAAFLWCNCHLWEFEFDGRCYGIPFDDDFGGKKIYSATHTRLTKLQDSDVTEFLYTYDMGDNWEHLVEVVELFDAPKGSRLPRFLDGQLRTPPEDVGGAPGFEMFLEAMADPNHEDHDDLTEWYGRPFEPEEIDLDIVTIQLRRLAKMRQPKK